MFGAMVSPQGPRVWLRLTLFWLSIPLIFVQAGFHQLRTKHAAIKRDALADSGLASASWIWASGTTTGNVAFLKTFTSSAGKIASSAAISLTAVNVATLWINGQPIGASNEWTSAEVFSAALNASVNTFSVLAGEHGQRCDGSTETVVSDSSWQAATNIPSDFPTPADTSQFASAAVAAFFGSGAWGTSVVVASPDTNAPTLVGGTWIWSTSDGEYAAPAGTVGFRRNVVTPSGKSAQSATILLTADNTFVLYVNGQYVGAPPNEANAVVESTAWGRAQQFNVGLSAASNVFTVIVTNYLNPTSGATSPAGLVASIRILYADGSSDIVGTDPNWLNGPYTGTAAFLAASDSSLAASFNVAAVGAWPWGQLSGISNVLAAANVPSAPFTSNIASSPNQGDTSPAGSTAGSSAGSSPQSQSAPAGASVAGVLGGGPSASAGGSSASAASTAHSQSSTGQPTTSRSTADVLGSKSSATATAPSSSSSTTSASSTHDTPVAAIVGAIASTLTLISLGLAIFYWRRRRYPRLVQRNSDASSIAPFFTDTPSPASSVIAPASRLSSGSIRRPEMAELHSQGLESMTPGPSVAAEAQASNPQDITLTKLERENMMRGNASSSTGGASDDILVSNGATPQSINTRSSSQEHGPLAIRPFSEAESAYDTLPPPSYYTE
ncbi:hypothetical protein MSAN_01565100 [Mycena sanguinolenta]|uniref:Uncharacterized protein n=1 Tax=Mycena sanguinolenta TaxID=230812 RepID=A0A8H6Y3K6_9AGAR|nr:hypothetical protein MSAN_01565100 [Mycena sanguinolenta]